jgi:hypothetical protein
MSCPLQVLIFFLHRWLADFCTPGSQWQTCISCFSATVSFLTQTQVESTNTFTDALTQAQLLLRDLKIAQCMFFLYALPWFGVHNRFLDTKLPPRAAFTAQIIGTLLGAILNYGMLSRLQINVITRLIE